MRHGFSELLASRWESGGSRLVKEANMNTTTPPANGTPGTRAILVAAASPLECMSSAKLRASQLPEEAV